VDYMAHNPLAGDLVPGRVACGSYDGGFKDAESAAVRGSSTSIAALTSAVRADRFREE